MPITQAGGTINQDHQLSRQIQRLHSEAAGVYGDLRVQHDRDQVDPQQGHWEYLVLGLEVAEVAVIEEVLK